MSIEHIELWHQKARPQPNNDAFQVQLGCHFEEITEMLEALELDQSSALSEDVVAFHNLLVSIHYVAEKLKKGQLKLAIKSPVALLDSLADQVVTAVGVGHCAGFQTAKAVAEVDRSNWSKFGADGNPIFNVNGKIIKGPLYKAPELAEFA